MAKRQVGQLLDHGAGQLLHVEAKQALIALVRLLARSAAREELAGVQADQGDRA